MAKTWATIRRMLDKALTEKNYTLEVGETLYPHAEVLAGLYKHRLDPETVTDDKQDDAAREAVRKLILCVVGEIVEGDVLQDTDPFLDLGYSDPADEVPNTKTTGDDPETLRRALGGGPDF
jgi:hypothetical protein